MHFTEAGGLLVSKSIYLALHNMEEDRKGKFFWSIVHAIPGNRLYAEKWFLENGKFKHVDLPRLGNALCAFEIKRHVNAEELSRIYAVGTEIAEKRSVSNVRKTREFDCRSVALDVLAEVFSNVAGEKSTELEKFAEDKANTIRNKLLLRMRRDRQESPDRSPDRCPDWVAFEVEGCKFQSKK